MAVKIRAVIKDDKTRQAFNAIRKLSAESLQDFCERVVELAKEAAPIDTGNLRDNIDWDEVKSGLFIIFTKTGYGAYQELGTVHMAAQPFIAPAIAQTIKEWQDSGKWDVT